VICRNIEAYMNNILNIRAELAKLLKIKKMNDGWTRKI